MADRAPTGTEGSKLRGATDLAAHLADKVKELDTLIDGFLKATGATFPRPNPAYESAEPQ